MLTLSVADDIERRLLENRHKFEAWLKEEDLVTATVNRRRKELQHFEIEFGEFEKMLGQSARPFSMKMADAIPCHDDRSIETPFEAHYTYHPAWAARVLARTRPVKHVDISSILSFATIASAFVPIDFFDFRPAPVKLSNFRADRANLTSLPFDSDSIASLSCMHVIEHIGLGRYGDPMDPDGDLKAIGELCRVLAPRGDLLIVVPVGRARIQFNAHRIYDHATFLEYFTDFDLIEFALIPDDGRSVGLINDAPFSLIAEQEYGCGCYWFRKRSSK
jgi:SAM-dependent methyltransferase